MNVARTERFVECPMCGKERECSTTINMATESYFRLCAISACRSCEMEKSMEDDRCPEVLTTEGGRGVVVCGGTWRHQGRCFPMITEDDMRAALSEIGGR